jgi:hypothetical protein
VAGHKPPHLLWAYRLIYLRLAVFIEDSDLKDVFGQIDRDGGSIVNFMGSYVFGELPL